jgi:ferredoxin
MYEKLSAKIREEAKKLLTEGKVDVVIGYEKGTLPLTAAPCFITEAEDTGRLIWDVGCYQNLAKFITDILTAHKEAQRKIRNPDDRKKKTVGIVAKGCTSRSIILHLQEKQYNRNEIVIIGVPCTGYIDRKKLAIIVDNEEITEANVTSGEVAVKTVSGDKKIPLHDVYADNCITCRFNNPVIFDIMAGDHAPAMKPEKEYEKIDSLEKMGADERFAYFTKEMSKCMRCYACRQACPSCYCKMCFVEQTQPQFTGLSADASDTQLFQMLRIFHMVGRCVDCGSCVNACPMGVDLRAYLKKLDKDVLELFDVRAGAKMEDVPPLSTYKENDKEDFIYHP